MVPYPLTNRNAMNLNIQLGWCRHWAREQLGIKPSNSVVLFICDARDLSGGLLPGHSEAIGAIMTEVRWQFSKPVSILLSVVRRSDGRTIDQSEFHHGALCGILDHQIPVDNASDLCGWIGACNTLFVVSKNQNGIEDKLVEVAYGFHVPMNLVLPEGGSRCVDGLDWERIHQVRTDRSGLDKKHAVMDFSGAVAAIEGGLLGKETEAKVAESSNPLHFRQAG
jgi:hypothetical protein